MNQNMARGNTWTLAATPDPNKRNTQVDVDASKDEVANGKGHVKTNE